MTPKKYADCIAERYEMRTRIATLLTDEVKLTNTWEEVADLLILGLGLHREGPQLCDGGSDRYRYVTEWFDNEN